MSVLQYVLRVAVVVLVSVVCAEASVYDGEDAEGTAAEGDLVEELMNKLSQGEAAEVQANEEPMSTFTRDEAAGRLDMEEFMSELSSGEAAEGSVIEELMNKLSQAKTEEEHPMEESMSKLSQEKATEGNSVEELMKENSQGKPAEGHTIEEIRKTLLKMIAAQTLIKALKGFQQGKGAEGHQVEELISKLSQMKVAQGHAMKKLLERLPQGKTLEGLRKLLTKVPHRNYFFNSSYVKVVVAAKGWKDRSLRETVVPLVYKAGLMSIVFAETNRTIIKSKLGRPTGSIEDNRKFFDPCEKSNLNKAGLGSCSMTKGLLHVVGVAATTAGHLSEAYVRTILFSDPEKFKVLSDEMFSVVTEVVSTNLVLLNHVLKMAVDFKNAVSARYLKGPFPVSGTEKDFVKASDQLYAAVADFALLSRITLEYAETALPLKRKSELDVVIPVLINSYEYVVKRGIPEGYNSSPYPPLSYYWDMAALQYAVSLLSDIEGLAERTVQEQENGTENFIIDKKPLSKAVTTVHSLLTSTSAKVKNDELQAALLSATKGIRLAVSSLEEAGLDLVKGEGSEILSELLVSLLETIFPPRPIFPHLPLGSTPSIPAKKPSLRMLASLIPSDYNELMKMATELAAFLAGAAGSLDWPAEKIFAPVTTEEPGLSGTVDFEEPDHTSKAKMTTGPLSKMLAGLRNEKAKSVLIDVLKGSDTELIKRLEDSDKCLLSSSCQQDLLAVLLQTSLVINNPALRQQWESTRSNPLKGKTLDELLADAGLPFRTVQNSGFPGALLNAGYPFGVTPNADSPFTTGKSKNEEPTETD